MRRGCTASELPGVLAALEEHQSGEGATCHFRQSKSRLHGLDQAGRKQILRHPWKSIASLKPADVSWLKANGNLFLTVQLTDDGSQFLRAFSFIEAVALTGLTKAMALLEDAARHGEDPENTPIDEWTLDTISANASAHIPGNIAYGASACGSWEPEKIKTLADYLQPTEWTVDPILMVACRRKAPNMEMIRTLVEDCGVAVDTPTTRYVRNMSPETTWKRIQRHPTVLHFLASGSAVLAFGRDPVPYR